jgi:pilus assembly protein Flp/PilA
MYVIMQEFIRRNLKARETGQGLVEYALIILLVAMVVIGAVTIFGQQLVAAFVRITASIP